MCAKFLTQLPVFLVLAILSCNKSVCIDEGRNMGQQSIYPFDGPAKCFSQQFQNGYSWHDMMTQYISFTLPGNTPTFSLISRPQNIDSIAVAAFVYIFDGYPPQSILYYCQSIELQIAREQDTIVANYHYSLYDNVFGLTWRTWPYKDVQWPNNPVYLDLYIN